VEEHSTAALLALNVARSHRAPRVVRQTVAGWLETFGGPAPFIDDVRLVVSELVANVVTHADSPVRVWAEVADGRLRLDRLAIGACGTCSADRRIQTRG
jgi:anti-sigma regulatory factor (Ser/Thr protein kinase)